MTHGEIRGTLLLLALMGAAVLSSYLSERPAGSQQSQTPTHEAVNSLSIRETDSLRMEESAYRYSIGISADSANIAGHSGKAGKKNRKSSSRGNRKRETSGSRHKSPSPTPSPLDRPI